VPKKRDPGIGLNGSVRNEIVAVFIPPTQVPSELPLSHLFVWTSAGGAGDGRVNPADAVLHWEMSKCGALPRYVYMYICIYIYMHT